MANAEKRNGNGRRRGNLDVSTVEITKWLVRRTREKERKKGLPNLSIERTDERRICGCTFLRGNANVLPSFFSLSLALIPAPG